MTKKLAVALLVLLAVGCETEGARDRDGELVPVNQYLLPKSLTAPSGMTLGGDILFVVDDKTPRVFAFTRFGVEVDRFTVDLPCDKDEGFEAIAFDAHRVEAGELLLACEPTGEIFRVDPANGAVRARIRVKDVVDGNSGLEGLLVRPDGHILAVKEKDPSVLVHLDADGVEIGRIRLDFASDVSGLAPLGEANCPDQLLVVSQEERRVFQIDETGAALGEWPIDARRPEGITYVRDTLYVVDEETRDLLVFDFPPGCR